MKTTLLFLLAVAGAGLGWPSSAQASQCARLSALAGVLSAQAGQTDSTGGRAEMRREHVSRLLQASRAAIEKRDWAAAEKTLVEAEGMNVPYNLFYLGDTPKKVRRDLDRLRAGDGPTPPSRKAKPFSPFVPSGIRGADAEDPFANGQSQADANAPPPNAIDDPAGRISRQSVAASKKRSASQATVSPDDITPIAADALPRPKGTVRSATQQAPAGSPGMAPPPVDDQTGSRLAMRARQSAKPNTSVAAPAATQPAPAVPQTDGPTLLEARKALAMGDVKRTSAMLAAIKRQPPRSLPPGESIERVEALVQQQEALRAARAAQGDTEEIRRDLAQHLVELAQGLLPYGELEEAERILGDANGLGVPLPASATQPATVLKQIARLRAGGPAEPARFAVAPGDGAPSVVTDSPGGDTLSPAKAQVLSLTARARAALESHDLPTAEMLLQQAMKISPPASEFGPQDDRPELVLRELQQARANGGVRTASATAPVAAPRETSSDPNVAHAFYDPRRDTTANSRATASAGRSDEPAPYDDTQGSGDAQWPSEPSGGEESLEDEFAFPEDSGDSPFAETTPGAGDAAYAPAAPQSSSRRGAGPPAAPGAADREAPPGARFFALGENALQNNDPHTALAFFRKAAQHADEFPPQIQGRLKQHLATLEPMVGGQQPAAVPAQFQAGQAGLIAPGNAPDAATDGALEASIPAAMPAPHSPATQADGAAEPMPEQGDLNSPGQTSPADPPQPLPPALAPGSLLGETAASQRLAIQRLTTEIARQQLQAKGLMERDPKQALQILDQAARAVQQSGVDTQSQSQLLARLERTRTEIEAYFEAHRATIELAERNEATIEQVDRERQHKREIEEKIAQMIDDFNRLMDEHRYEEAGIVAKQAFELDPDSPVTTQLKWQANFVIRMRKQNEINDAKERGFIDSLNDVEIASIPFDDYKPLQFGSKPEWDDMTKRRLPLSAERPRDRKSTR
ncbi:MAG: hypothetical protein AB7U73_16835, partial [Pirellulales bacterium]